MLTTHSNARYVCFTVLIKRLQANARMVSRTALMQHVRTRQKIVPNYDTTMLWLANTPILLYEQHC